MNKIIRRRNITPLPITHKVVKKVAALAETKGMPSGLKIVSTMDTILYNLAWIAGVDTPDNNDNNNDNNNKIQDDEMHPNNIAGLAPTRRQQENSYDQINNEIKIVDGHQDQTDNNEEIEIVFKPDEEATNVENLEEDDEPDDPEFDWLIQTRSGQVSRPVHKYVTSHQGQGHLSTQATHSVEYSIETAKVIAQTINTMNHQFAQTYSLTKSIKTFGKKRCQAAHKEMKQLHNCIVFKPIKVEELNAVKQRQAMESLIFITKKKDGRIKARACTNGSTQHEYTKCNEAASATALTESHLITAVIDAKQGRNIMTADISNAFVQTEIENKANSNQTIMKIQGQLVDMLVNIAPQELLEGHTDLIYF
jgi:hypothetical protein